MAVIRKSKKRNNSGKKTKKVRGGGWWGKKSKVTRSKNSSKKAKEPTVQLTPNALYGVHKQNVSESHYKFTDVFNHRTRTLPPTPQETFLKSVEQLSPNNIKERIQSARQQERPSPFSRKQFRQQALGPKGRKSKSYYKPTNNMNFIQKSNNSTNQQSLLNARARILQHTPSATISSINDAQEIINFLKFKSQHMGTRLNGNGELSTKDKQLFADALAHIRKHNAELAKKFRGLEGLYGESTPPPITRETFTVESNTYAIPPKVNPNKYVSEQQALVQQQSGTSPPPPKSKLRQPMSAEEYRADQAQSFSQHGIGPTYEQYLRTFVES